MSSEKIKAFLDKTYGMVGLTAQTGLLLDLVLTFAIVVLIFKLLF